MTASLISTLSAESKQLLREQLCAVINESRQKLLRDVLNQRTRHITLVLEDIYQPQNASAVIRTAECLGLQEMHVIENRNQYQLNPAVVQGASKWIEVNRYSSEADNTFACLEHLKSRGYKILAMTLRPDSTDIRDVDLNQKVALCFGSEEPGLSELAHEQAEQFVKIPMCGFTQSFNLSVSAGISLYEFTRRIRESDTEWQLGEDEKLNLYIDWLSRSTPTGRNLLNRFMNELAAN